MAQGFLRILNIAYNFVWSPLTRGLEAMEIVQGIYSGLSVMPDSLNVVRLHLQVCYAFSRLAAGFVTTVEGTSPLSPYFKDIIQSLLEAVRTYPRATAMQRSSARL